MGLSQFKYEDSLVAYWKGNAGTSGLYVKNEVWPHNYPLLRVGNPSGTFSSQISGLPSAQWLLTNCSGTNPISNCLYTLSGYTFPQSGRIDYLFLYNGYDAKPTGNQEEQLLAIGSGNLFFESRLVPADNGFLSIRTAATSINGSSIVSGSQYKISMLWNTGDDNNNQNKYRLLLNNSLFASLSGTNFGSNGKLTIGQFDNPNRQLTESYIGPVVLSSDVNFDTRTLGWPL